MNYDLAKKLKDAGFPQNFGDSIPVKEGLGEMPYTPTLEELIEACGDVFFRLSHSKNNDGTTWDAESWSFGDIETGSTPTEAVANLWLALNEKTK